MTWDGHKRTWVRKYQAECETKLMLREVPRSIAIGFRPQQTCPVLKRPNLIAFWRRKTLIFVGNRSVKAYYCHIQWYIWFSCTEIVVKQSVLNEVCNFKTTDVLALTITFHSDSQTCTGRQPDTLLTLILVLSEHNKQCVGGLLDNTERAIGRTLESQNSAGISLEIAGNSVMITKLWESKTGTLATVNK